VCGRTEAAINKLNTYHYSRDRVFLGTPAQLLEQLQPFVDLGVDYFMLQAGGFPDLTTLELLVSEVIPALNR
jgi:alkanesulfonate monooxygenase SsuD/methylene tetrahydromethanopterin reductase-like flavin-dependent oxidoreductase (luciferase family)